MESLQGLTKHHALFHPRSKHTCYVINFKENYNAVSKLFQFFSLYFQLPRMTPYIRFCSCQLSAAALLQHLTETSFQFQLLSKKCQSDPRTKGMPLSSFLIKPMQRITKYPLLIKKVISVICFSPCTDMRGKIEYSLHVCVCFISHISVLYWLKLCAHLFKNILFCFIYF